MGSQTFKEKLAQYSEASGSDVEDDLEKFKKEEEEKRKLLQIDEENKMPIPPPPPLPKTPLPKTPPPPPPLPITPIPETPDYLEVDVLEEDPFGPQCMICMSRVQRGMLELEECGHRFHRRCLQPWVDSVPKKGQRFLTSRARCPCCRGWAISKVNEKGSHIKINDLVVPIVEQFQKMCDLLLQNEEISQKHREAIQEMKNAKKELPFMKEYVFYLCFDCNDVFFGGLVECQQQHGEEDNEADEKDHICVKCVNKKSDMNYPEKCEKHGEAFIVFKCRYCCNIANFYCGVGKGGHTHFCERCHKAWNSGTIKPIPCPGKPECDGQHVKNGDEKENEQCLGCVLCRNEK